MSLSLQLNALVERIGQEFREVNTYATGSVDGSLAGLKTESKTHLVAAINEVNKKIIDLDASALVIDDSVSTTDHAWSGSKVSTELEKVKADILGGTDINEALDTIKELAAYAEANKGLIDQLESLAGKRIAVDSVQSFTAEEKAQGRKNLGIDTIVAGLEADHVVIDKEVKRVEGLVTAEQAARLASISDINDAIGVESAQRKAADATHTSAIADESAARKKRDGELTGMINAEKTAREEADSQMSTKIDTEISERKAADSSIRTSIVTQVSAAKTELNSVIDGVKDLVKAEETARTNADNLHDQAITKEGKERIAAIQGVEKKVTAEATARANAISSESTKRQAAEKVIDDKVDALATAVGDMQADFVAVFEAALVAQSEK